MWGDLFNECTSHDDFKPYIINDKGYHLLRWLMVLQPHKVQHYVLETFYNKQLFYAKVIVENSFSILKKHFSRFDDQVQHVCAFPLGHHYLLLYVTQHDTKWEGY
jgi:hypothetical protein